jgi:hypothetical protein
MLAAVMKHNVSFRYLLVRHMCGSFSVINSQVWMEDHKETFMPKITKLIHSQDEFGHVPC